MRWETRWKDVGASAGAVVLLAAFVPVCATLARGGADWHLGSVLRVSWYDAEVAWVALAASVLIVFVRPASSAVFPRLAFAAACLVLTSSALILWSGGGRFGPLSLRHPEPSIGLAVALLVSSLWSGGGARVVAKRGRAALVLGLGFAVGLATAFGIEHLDRLQLESALSGPSRASDRRDETGPSGAPHEDLVWIVVDTLRADSIGAYRRAPDRTDREGGEDARRAAGDREAPRSGVGAETPTLDRLAARGGVFERAFAPAPWTVPSIMSLWTARHPSTLDPVGRGESVAARRLPRLDPAVPTWIERLREAGYRTAGFQKNPFLGPGSGVEAPFDLYRMVGGDRAERRSAAQLVRASLRWADAMASRRAAERLASGPQDPYLLYVHFMDPHVDYDAPDRWREKTLRDYTGTLDGTAKNLHARLAGGAPLTPEDRAHLQHLYAAEVAYLDDQIGRLLEGLRERALLDDSTLVVVTSDHGEQFGEHGGWEHGDLHAENVHVPWIVVGRGLSPRRLATPVSTLDLGPTILELLGVAPLSGAEGVGRAAWLEGEVARRASPGAIVTEFGGATRWLEDPWVLIENADGRVELFDTARDPGERADLADLQVERVTSMRTRLAAHRERNPQASSPRLRDLDPETRAGLRALGYEW